MKNNKKTGYYTLAIVALLFVLIVGYAALQTNLSINGTTTVAKNNWDIHFENVTVNPNSSTVSIEQAATINDSKTGVDFEVTLAMPNHYYELTVDVVNNGTIDAKLDTVVKTTLSDAQEKYLNYYVTYADGAEIKKNDLLAAGARDTIKVTVEFQQDPVQLPSSETTIALSANLIYVQDDETGVSRNTNVLYNVLKDNATIDTGVVNLGQTSEANGTNGVYTLAKTANYPNPIYYYRGAVDNNVIFGGYCWKMIRTTDTGGIKLIYNGVPTEGKCTATGEATQIGTSAYNTSYNDSKYVGYMYEDTVEGETKQVNSTIKGVIDTWYGEHLTGYTKYLEDSPFYNERDSVAGDGVPLAFAPRLRIWGNGTTNYAENIANTTVKLGATNAEDKFTVSSSNGNGLLTYPVGLLTSDEAVLAGGRGWASESDQGANNSYYLYTGAWYWTISPNDFWSDSPAHIIFVNSRGNVVGRSVDLVGGVRPVVSLKTGTIYSSGDGSSENPYVVDTSRNS